MNDFTNHIKMGRHLQMQEALSAQSYNMMNMFYGSITDKALKPYYRSKNVADITFIKLSETDTSSRFKVRVTTKSGKVYSDTIDLVLQNGDWKVSDF